MVVLLSGNLQEIIEGKRGLQAGMTDLGLGETFKEHSQILCFRIKYVQTIDCKLLSSLE